MSFGGFNDNQNLVLMVDINVILMVDVMLVLLVIFIIIVFMFIYVLKLDLFIVQFNLVLEKLEIIILGIDVVGKLYWNDQLVSEVDMDVCLVMVVVKKLQFEL